jgi:hypothetical protein
MLGFWMKDLEGRRFCWDFYLGWVEDGCSFLGCWVCEGFSIKLRVLGFYEEW